MTNQQRVAVVTGASQGIGEGLVAGFRTHGYAVVANSRTIAASDDPMVLTVAGDISAPGVGQRIVDAAVAAMLSQGDGGHVVNISTSLVDHANSAVPSAMASLTKGGLNAVTKSLAIEYAGRNIRSNTVALGIIRTPMHDESSYDAMAAMHPLGRIGEVDDVVNAVLYLDSAPFVTGEVLHVDGGQSAGH
jgi:NAD(P)-dependent dehydrogenase (short-subunit alcohol dehydrogenase family)